MDENNKLLKKSEYLDQGRAGEGFPSKLRGEL